MLEAMLEGWRGKRVLIVGDRGGLCAFLIAVLDEIGARPVCVSDRATAYNVMAHTNCVSTGSGVMPEGYGDDRLMTLPLIGDVPDMRLGVIRPRDVPLTDYGEKFIAILKDIVSELNQEA